MVSYKIPMSFTDLKALAKAEITHRMPDNSSDTPWASGERGGAAYEYGPIAPPRGSKTR